MSVFAQDREQCIKVASYFSKVLYDSVSTLRRNKYFKAIPKKFSLPGNQEPVLWTDSFKFRELPDDAFNTFKVYTRYLLMMQEMRGKKDKFSDKMYRLPVGAGAIQIHVENAVSLYNNVKKPVVIVHHDVNTLIKIAWALKINEIKGVFVNMTELPGKLIELGPYVTNDFKGKIKFNYKCTTIGSPKQDKNKTEADLFRDLTAVHYDHFHALPPNTAVLIKSFYFPPIEGVVYYPSSEPHNGSIIAVRGDVVAMPNRTYAQLWEETLINRKRNLNFSYYKTMFAISREYTMRKVLYRKSIRCEPIAPSLAPTLQYEEETDAKMGELEDDYVQPALVETPKKAQSTNSSNSSKVVENVTTTTNTTVTTTTSTSQAAPTVVATTQNEVKGKRVTRQYVKKEVKVDEEPPLKKLEDV
jgi:hypothetical protein